MSCGISRMYKVSGGTDKKMRKCGDCPYLIKDEESTGFGRKGGSRVTYRCSKHPDGIRGGNVWDDRYPACKKIDDQEGEWQTNYRLGDNGQYVLVLA